MSTVFIHKIRNKTCSPQLKIQPNNARNNLQKNPHGGSDGAAIGATTGDGGVTIGVVGGMGTGTEFGGSAMFYENKEDGKIDVIDSNKNLNSENNDSKESNNKDNMINSSTKKEKIKTDIDKAILIATSDLNFDHYNKNSIGFQQAYSSLNNKTDKFFEFLRYFTVKEFTSTFTKNEITLDLILFIFKVFQDNLEIILSKNENLILCTDYLIAITKTKNFSLKKIMLKNKKDIINELFLKLSVDKEFNRSQIEKMYV